MADATATVPAGPFADPTPVGLIGLAIGCAALTPISFGLSLTPAGLRTAAIYCLLFGAGGQLVAGLLNLANRNLYGGTLFTAFSFNWIVNWWGLREAAEGRLPDHATVLAVDIAFLVIFLVFTYGFAFFSRSLALFLLDIVLLYACRIAKAATGTTALDLPMGLLVVTLGLLSLWIAFAILVNPVAGRRLFPLGGPILSRRA